MFRQISTDLKSWFKKLVAPQGPPRLAAERLLLRAPGLVGGRLKFNAIDPDHRSAEVRPAVEAVEKAGVIRRVCHSAGQSLPLATGSHPRIATLVMLDVGLMHAALRIDAELIQQPDLLGIHRGAVAEQFAAQELLACGPPDREPELYFRAREQRNSQAEEDRRRQPAGQALHARQGDAKLKGAF